LIGVYEKLRTLDQFKRLLESLSEEDRRRIDALARALSNEADETLGNVSSGLRISKDNEQGSTERPSGNTEDGS